MTQFSHTTVGPYATLLYVVPLDAFDPKNETDVAALHVLEHWILEGAGDLRDSAAVFKAARKLGGNISATVSRKTMTIKLTYLATFKTEAVRLMQSVATEPLLQSSTLQAQIDEVRDELQYDSWLKLLFDQYYAAAFSDRYGLTGGGTTDTIGLVTEPMVRAYANILATAPAQLFWAGPAGCEPDAFTYTTADVQNFKPAKLKLNQSQFYADDGEFALLGVDTSRGQEWLYGLDTFIEVEFGNYASFRTHVLPGVILAGVSFDIPELKQTEVAAAIERYSNLTATERAHYKKLADAVTADMMANSDSAANSLVERWLSEVK